MLLCELCSVLLPVLLLHADGLLPANSCRARQFGREVLLSTMTDSTKNSEAIWLAFGADLRTFLRSRVGNHADADDLLQTVFVRVVEKVDSLRQSDRVESWVYQVARN